MAHRSAPTPGIGALFIPGLPLHICTAGVVRTASRDVVVTAAHCLTGNVSGYRFAPDYSAGHAPYGMWTVTAAYGSPGWIRHQDPHQDWAFLVVAPRRIDGRMREVQQVAGGSRLGPRGPVGTKVRVTGYPLGIGGRPITCRAPVHRQGRYSAFGCAGYADGTSGAPWLRGRGAGRTVVGVLGGLHQGGCTPSVSYAAPFGAPARRTLARAVRGRGANFFPKRPNDGC